MRSKNFLLLIRIITLLLNKLLNQDIQNFHHNWFILGFLVTYTKLCPP